MLAMCFFSSTRKQIAMFIKLGGVTAVNFKLIKIIQCDNNGKYFYLFNDFKLHTFYSMIVPVTYFDVTIKYRNCKCTAVGILKQK